MFILLFNQYSSKVSHLFDSYYFSHLQNPYQWNHTRCTILCPAPVVQYYMCDDGPFSCMKILFALYYNIILHFKNIGQFHYLNMDIWVLSSLGVEWTKFIKTFLCVSFDGNMYSFLTATYLRSGIPVSQSRHDFNLNWHYPMIFITIHLPTKYV